MGPTYNIWISVNQPKMSHCGGIERYLNNNKNIFVHNNNNNESYYVAL